MRIYDPDSHKRTFRVRVIEETGNLLKEFILTTAILGEPPPGFVSEIPAIATIYDLRSALGSAALGRVNVLIEPLSVDVRFWAFAAVTNNNTNAVTVISPQ